MPYFLGYVTGILPAILGTILLGTSLCMITDGWDYRKDKFQAFVAKIREVLIAVIFITCWLVSGHYITQGFHNNLLENARENAVIEAQTALIKQLSDARVAALGTLRYDKGTDEERKIKELRIRNANSLVEIEQIVRK